MKSRKFLLSLVCALVLVFGSCITVCAEETTLYEQYGADYEVMYEKLVAEYGEVPYLVYYNGGSHSVLCGSTQPFVLTDYEQFKLSMYSNADTYQIYHNIGLGAYQVYTYPVGQNYGTSGTYTLVSNHDMCDESGNVILSADNTGFFPKTPILKPTVAGMEMNPLGQILGLLPLLIPLVVGLVALRKGLQALWNHLHKA